MKSGSAQKQLRQHALRVVLVSLNIALATALAAVMLTRCGTDRKKGPAATVQSASHESVDPSVEMLPSIRVITSPVKAAIYIDGKFAGEAPALIKSLDPGKYRVEARKQGYRTTTRYLEVGFGQRKNVELSLELITGELFVESKPPRAEVTLNGELQKSLTPLHLRQLLPGRYELSVRANGFATHESSVMVRDGQSTEYSVHLEMTRRGRFSQAAREIFARPPKPTPRSQQASVQQQRAQREPPRLASSPARARESADHRRGQTPTKNESLVAATSGNARQSPPARSTRAEQSMEARQRSGEKPDAPAADEIRSRAVAKNQAAGSAPVPSEPVPSESVPPAGPDNKGLGDSATDDRTGAAMRTALRAPEPVYPVRAMRQGTEGEVVAAFWVERDGRVGSIEIISSQPRRTFDRAVVDALRSWRFEEGEQRERLVRTFEFVLEGQQSANAVRQLRSQSEIVRTGTNTASTRNLIRRVEPDYPRTALLNGIEGVVRFELGVQSDGSVTSIQLLDRDRPRVFDREVQRALRQWRFEPGAVSNWTFQGEIDFRLDD